MNKPRLFSLFIFLLTAILLSSSCRNSLVVNKRQHKKGFYISWPKSEKKNSSFEVISKQSIKTDIENIEKIFEQTEDTLSFIAEIEQKTKDEGQEQFSQKTKSNFDLYDILNQNTKAYTAAYTIKDLKSLREELRTQEYKRSFDAVLEFIIYLSLWIGLIVLFFFIEPIVAWVLLGILVVILILIIWAIIAVGKALRDFRSNCHRSCRPPSGCH